MRLLRKIFVCALATAMLVLSLPTFAQDKAAPAARPMGADETRQASAIAAVPSATEKLPLLQKFLAAHPDSPLRARLLTHVGVAIAREPDAVVHVSLAEKFIALMSTDAERAVASEILADAYLKANRVDDAFQTIAALPSAESVDLRLLARLTFAGTIEIRQRNQKHLVLSQKFGALAIRAIEADLRPFDLNAAQWPEYKSKNLRALHQSLGLLALHAGTPADGMAHLQKAIELAPEDPLSYFFLGAAMHEEYLKDAQQLKQMPPGPERDALGKKIMDEVGQAVDAFAHALALSAGTPQEQGLREQVWPDLESYYKFLHNGSSDGLQALIEKYKKK